MKVLKYSSIAIVLVVPLFLMMGCAGASWSFSDMLPGNGPKTVGADVKMEDITDFYFTYDSSTNPPQFQRYRFSVKDGTYQFYHEKREGNHWPLREKDITVSGTKELSLEEWKTFFDYLKDGKVEKRKEHLESGGRGPWLFLYWKGDKGKIQEFTFASYEKRISFEKYCVKLKEEQTGK